MPKYFETRAYGVVVERWKVDREGYTPTRYRFTWTAAVSTPSLCQQRHDGPMWKIEEFFPFSGEWHTVGWQQPTIPPDSPDATEQGYCPTERYALNYTLERLGKAIDAEQHKLDEMRQRFNAMTARLGELEDEQEQSA